MRQKLLLQCSDTYPALAQQLGLPPKAQHPVGFSTKPLEPDEESLISDVSRVPGDPALGKLEIEKLMRHRLVRNRDEILKALQSIIISWPGKVQKKKLYEIINAFWVRITHQQYEALLSDVQVHEDGNLDYRELLLQIEGKRRMKYGLTLREKTKYGIPAPPLLTIPGLDFALQAKINSNMKEVTRGLRMYEERNGLIKRQALKKVLDTFAVATRESQFDKLMQYYDPHNTGYVNIHDFLIQLGVHVHNYAKQTPDRQTAAAAFNWNEPFFDDLDVNTRENAIKFSKTDPDLLGLSVDEILVKFEDKVAENAEELTKCFLTYDIANSGLIPKDEFRNVLNYFVYPTSDSLFKTIQTRLGIKKVGKMIAWERFVENVKQKAAASPREQKPIVHRWNKDPHAAIWTKTTGAEICKCGELTSFQQNPLTIKGIMEKLRKFGIIPGPVTRKIFTIRTNVGEKLVTRSDFKLFLGRRCCIMSERELKDLMDILDPDHSNTITYNRFQTLFCENPPPPPPTEKEELEIPDVQLIQPAWCKAKYNLAEAAVTGMAPCFPDLSPDDAIVKVRRRVHKNWDDFARTVLSRAHGRNGSVIYQEELRVILDVMAMQLTDSQWNHLMKSLGITSGQINAQYFLEALATLNVEVLDRWNRKVFKLFGEKKKKMTHRQENDFETRLLDVVKKKGKYIHRDLVEMDPKSYGFITMTDFRKVLSRYLSGMTEMEFKSLYRSLPSNEYCNIDYETFLRKYKHFYDARPEHRCECECDFSNSSLAAGDENQEVDRRLLAGGMHADKKPENTPSGNKVSNPQKKDSNDNGASTSKNENNVAISNSTASVATINGQEGVVHVPFRPPTPPKLLHHKDSGVGPLVLHKNENDQPPRQSAGMDLSSSLHVTVPSSEGCEDPLDIGYCRLRRDAKSIEPSSAPHSCHCPRPLKSSSSRSNSKIPCYQPKLLMKSSSSQSVEGNRKDSSKASSVKTKVKTGKSHLLIGGYSEQILKRIINKNWREMRLELNKVDNEGMGFVTNQQFRNCLNKYGVPMNCEMDNILKRFDVPNTGPVNYLKFLQAFVIHLEHEPVTITMRRKIQEVPKIPLGSPSAGLYDTLLSLRAPVLAHLIDLRRVLRNHDKTGRGWIHAIDFRKLLRHFNLTLSDERFFFLMEYFDPNLTGHFYYNEFLRVFTSIH